MDEVDIAVSNGIMLDFCLFDKWLAGYAVNETARMICDDPENKKELTELSVGMDTLKADVGSSWHLFAQLEKLLKSPHSLSRQLTFEIRADMKNKLIEMYYKFDDAMMREVLGKKLSHRNRKDLDDVSDKTGVRLRSCRRQFDNMKRVYKAMEDTQGYVVPQIQAQFLISEQLAEKYAVVVFIASHKFETCKKKCVSYLTYNDIVSSASEMMQHWTCKGEASTRCAELRKKDASNEDSPMLTRRSKNYEDTDLDLDKDFLMDLREFKVILDKDLLDNHKLLVCKALHPKLLEDVYNDLDMNFKNFSKAIVMIAYNLNHSKELRDLFVDLVEKIIEPMHLAKWSLEDVKEFLTAYKDCGMSMESFASNYKQHFVVWKRYLDTLFFCIITMYHM